VSEKKAAQPQGQLDGIRQQIERMRPTFLSIEPALNIEQTCYLKQLVRQTEHLSNADVWDS